MRILAVRGANLASLVEFDLDFERAPLGGAGLFAITGPTGAGKSTLLDAICLGLFDRTPRLGERGGPVIGRADEDPRLKLRSRDVRAVLSRGRAEGWCEVDFLGRDARRYRTRWEVRRARRRTDGAFQDQELSFVDLGSGVSLGGTRTETLAEIEARLGLSFEQFRRSVLLAQGEFAAFLRAPGKERAELLERMTGTAIYGRISRHAHLRFHELKGKLEELDRRKSELNTRPAEERARLVAEREELEARQEAMRRRIAALEDQLRWYGEAAKLEAEEAEAGRRLAEAEKGWTEAQPLLAELARLEAVEPLRSRIEALDRAGTEAARTAAAVVESAQRLKEAETEREASLVERDRAEAAAATAIDAARRLEPDLQRAAHLDSQIAEREASFRQATERLRQATDARAQAEQKVRDLETAVSTGQGAEAGLLAELAAGEAVRPVAREWSRWEAELGRIAGLDKSAAEAEARRRTFQEGLEAARSAQRAVEARMAEARGPLEAARTAAEEAARAAAEHPLAELQALQERLLGRRDILLRMREAGERAARAADREAAHRAETAGARVRAEAAQTERQGFLRRIGEVRSARAEARRGLERARSALDLGARRAELRPGEPCPLCGSQDHPYRHAERTLEPLVAEMERRTHDLEEELRGLERSDAEKEAERKAAEESARRTSALEEEARAERQEVKAQWTRLGMDLGTGGLPDDPADPAVDSALAAHLQRVDAELEATRTRQKEAARSTEAARGAEAELKRRQAELDEAREARQKSEAAVIELEPKLAMASGDLERIERERTHSLDLLAEPFAGLQGWREQVATGPEAFRKAISARVEERTRIEASLAKERERGLQLRAELEAAREKAAERVERDQEARQAVVEAERELEARRVERRHLLDGRPAAQVAEEARTRMQAAQSAAEAARERFHRAERGLDVRRSEEENARRAAEFAAADRGETERELSARLVAQGLDLSALRGLLAAGGPPMAERRAALDELRRKLDEARAQLEDRRARRARHLSGSIPDRARDVAEAEKQAAADELRSSEARLAEVRTALAVDDAARKRAGELEEALTKERREAETWQVLDGLIGSHDGTKMRAFAQSLTLDALLEAANQRLDELTHRYRLVRVPDEEMELQVVDRDMGEEIRSVSSLSGGESFLASLALALGLSTLSARSTRIESLFIDEGFGTLDPATLDVALSALDALQAAGCQVGVISHVPGLAERIGTVVEVVPRGGGRSAVEIRSA